MTVPDGTGVQSVFVYIYMYIFIVICTRFANSPLRRFAALALPVASGARIRNDIPSPVRIAHGASPTGMSAPTSTRLPDE